MESVKYYAEYETLFNNCLVKPGKEEEIKQVVDKLINCQSRYETVGRLMNIPWYFLAVIHYMEGDCSFSTHLHNGDPLIIRTTHIPKGRPVKGMPPFTWEESAVDAMEIKGYSNISDWSLPAILYRLEKYNGFGYRRFNVPSPYLWSFSNHYQKGKFTADGYFDHTAVSKQAGAAVILKLLV